MTIGNLCWRCQRYQEELKCQAFDVRIPQEILNGKLDHRKPVAGDNGLQFVEKKSLSSIAIEN